MSSGQPRLKKSDPLTATKLASIEGITAYELANGLQVLLFPDASKPVVTVNMTVLVGSRHEGYGEAGMAHLLEHMLFKGTPSIDDIPGELKRRGANYNGTTWLDRTNYYETLPATTQQQGDENLEYAIRMEADRLVNSKISDEDLRSEMNVVRNEFERGENSPTRILLQRVQAAAFEWHNYGRVTIGNLSDIERVPVERLRGFYRKFYRPDNVVVILSGRFEEDRGMELINQYFGSLLKPDSELDRTYTVEPPQDGERSVVLRRVGNTQFVCAAYHVPSGANREYAAVALLAKIMTAEPSGRLYEQIVKPELASDAFSLPMALYDPGLALFGLQVPVDASLDDARDKMLEILEGVANNPITETELVRAKNQYFKGREFRAADTTRIAIELSEWAAQGDWRLYFLFRDYIETLTAEECTVAAANLLTRNNRTLGLFIPSEESQRCLLPEKPDLPTLFADYQGRGDAEPGEAFDVDPLAIEARTVRGELGSGIKTAFLAKRTRGSTVNLRLALRYGNEVSLAPFLAAADFLPVVLLRGTADLEYETLQDRFDTLMARVHASGQAGILILSVQTIRKNLADVLHLIKEVLRRPGLSEEQLEIEKRHQLAALEAQRVDPTTLARIELHREMTQYAPEDIRYVPTLDETISRYKSVTAQQLRNLYSQVGGQYGEATVVGDFDVEDLKLWLEELFADWTTATSHERVASPARVDLPATVRQIETPDKPNAVYVAGQAIAMRDNDPEFPALTVGNFILGGGGALSSRLGNSLRKQEGLSYSVASVLHTHPIDCRGSLMLHAIASPQDRSRVHHLFREVIGQLLADGITDVELSHAKQSILQGEQVGRTRDASLAALLGNSIFAGRDLRFNATFEATVETLSVAEVNAALRRFIDLEKLFLVSAGDFASCPAGN